MLQCDLEEVRQNLSVIQEEFESLEKETRIKVEGKACRSPPQLDWGIWQLQNGICLHEGRTPSQAMGASQGASWRDYSGGIWILSKRWGFVPTMFGILLEGNASFGDAPFRFQQSVSPLWICIQIWYTRVRSIVKAGKWWRIRWSH